MLHRGSDSRCRRRAGISLAALGAAVVTVAAGTAGCADDRSEASPQAPAADPKADHDEAPEEREERGRWASRYYEGYLAETMRGDLGAARAAYADVITHAGAEDPNAAARAALGLARIEALAGRRREAVELVARASVLGRDDIAIVEQADRLQARLASVRSRGSEVRGPPVGTELEGARGEVGEAFAAAEELLAAYHRVRLQPRLEELRTSVRAKERAVEAAVRSYREVADAGDPAATAAAEFRIGSLYQDLAFSLMFDLPPELEPQVAARIRRSQRAKAMAYLARAQEAYRAGLDAGHDLEGASAERWRVPASEGLRAVEDMLGGR